jgi:hypothetical protein
MRMLQNGRAVDNGFRFFHCLYHRYKLEDIGDGRLISLRIPYKNASVNWSKYSKPWDVIFDYPGEGIGQFLVCGLPKELPIELPLGQQRNPPKPHSFYPSHVPEAENYAHCEIWTFKEGAHVPSVKLPETVKKEFRQIMSDRCVLLLVPSL